MSQICGRRASSLREGALTPLAGSHTISDLYLDLDGVALSVGSGGEDDSLSRVYASSQKYLISDVMVGCTYASTLTSISLPIQSGCEKNTISYASGNANKTLLTSRERREAKDLLLESKRAQLPDDKDLDDLWNALEKNKEASVEGTKCFITYPNFLKTKQEVCLKVSHFFSAPNFAKLSHGERFSRVNIDDFFAFVKKTVCLQQTRISLSNYDRRGDGYLQEDDLEAYITNLIPSLCHVSLLMS
nr:serine:threonine protein phosphatase 2A [Hymenolepis microstoma]